MSLLKEKVGVVTGANGKLGAIWVETLLQNGAKVFAIDKQINGSFLSDFKREYEERLEVFESDIIDPKQVKDSLERCKKILGSPDILVNNAGIDQPPKVDGGHYALEAVPKELFMSVVEVNLYGSFLMTQVFGAEMIKQKSGSIINIGSLYASVSPDYKFYSHIEGFIKPPAYGPSKAGVVNMTKYFATHWGAYNVRVNALSPGGVLGNQDETFKAKFCDRVPMRRMATADDLKGPMVFLASDMSQYVTGTEVIVDGGFTAW